MYDDNTPRRPDGYDDDAVSRTGSNPRLEVEPTPVSSDSTYQAQQAQPTERVSAQSAPGDWTYAKAAPTETVTRTVVKTKTKKLPVFLASFAGLVVGAVLVIALVMSGVFSISDTDVEVADTSETTTEATSTTITIDSEDTTLAEVVAAKCLPSVVSMTVTTSDGSSGIGSGVILDTDGNILTNYHVIEDAAEIVVTLDSGDTYEAEVVGSDSSSDIAVVVLVDADDAELTPIEIGDSSDLTVGEWVMAIGSPFGNEQSVSTGIVSALYRSTSLTDESGTSIYVNMIQTDAAINPGNSGGALVNSEGQLIGINSVIESYSGSSSGVGFAIPINYAMGIVEQILAGETVVHPYLGVTLTSLNALTAQSYGLSVTEGAYVVSVTEGSPADEAGVEAGDVIIALDDTEIDSADGLIIAVRACEVGDTVTLTVVRDGSEITLTATLGSDEALQTEEEDSTSDELSLEDLDDMTEDEMREYLEDLLNGLNGDSDSDSDSDSGDSDSFGNNGGGSGNNGFGF